ncbi:hypothetical protein NRI_0179 [Neorickettsia risticii str. Illinois]|uniref:Uncharacterized protein n=1 Tax=Neorickettsia risticii (strain Illinois) TaxID=434131 RepID=C6V455_NEORI|nr:hypothetical protein NRI_0179 [Neorickettsia risticii str. Illinois]
MDKYPHQLCKRVWSVGTSLSFICGFPMYAQGSLSMWLSPSRTKGNFCFSILKEKAFTTTQDLSSRKNLEVF